MSENNFCFMCSCFQRTLKTFVNKQNPISAGMCNMAASKSLCAFEISLLVLFVSLTPLCAFKHFSTKTPYSWIYGSEETNLEDKLFNQKVGDLMCSAVHTSVVVRHGTRFPGQDDVQKISEIHSRLAPDSLNGLPDLMAWKNPFPDNDRKSLADLGEVELEKLGKRTAQRLFSLFAEEDIDSFRYIISSKERTKDSGRSFFDGFTRVLQEEVEEEDDDYEPEIIDKILRFHTLCDKYVQSVGENKTALKEYYTFQSGDRITAIKDKIYTKLGIPVSDDVLTGGDLRTIYLMCGYEAAIFESSPWCQLFEEDDMKTLEYLGDLKHYYKNGPGHEINWKQACPLVSDIFYTMDDAIDALETMDGSDDDEGYIIGQFAFGHAETLGPLYSALGLFNDTEPLRADNFDRVEQRLYRSSFILPFGANLQFVLYECEPEEQYLNPEDEDSEHHPEYYLKLLVNEKVEKIPGCEEEMCLYTTVRDKLREQIDDCNFVKTCKTHVRDEL
ncbi:multiple inositol polyphosphate phosphatase 1-like [Babylonia areolata]|uniref:multiple inositol polyphosphate phosphatase 1-like n=1 Tax=Babylonia areolata TaxID=304850 RepID=UPI003FD29EED